MQGSLMHALSLLLTAPAANTDLLISLPPQQAKRPITTQRSGSFGMRRSVHTPTVNTTTEPEPQDELESILQTGEEGNEKHGNKCGCCLPVPLAAPTHGRSLCVSHAQPTNVGSAYCVL